MLELLKIAIRNLVRNWRRTLLTAGLITVGVLAVLLFTALAGSFKNLMIGQFTDSVLGHLEIHSKGYVASIDTLPLNLNMSPQKYTQIEAALTGESNVVAYSPRVKFGGMFSNFTETTSVRINGVEPERETAALPMLQSRIVQGAPRGLLQRGEIVIPELLARGMKVKVGATVVVVATNQDGSVNGQTFVVRGVISGLSGPGGRDAYIHIEDARHLLRMPETEVSEVVVRLEELDEVPQTIARLQTTLVPSGPASGRPLEVHGWDQLSPFANVARMIDLLTAFIKVILISIVLISVMNVMVMAVYERMREIGTIAAIGTPPRRIMSLFLIEGLLLGVVGTLIGVALSLGAVAALNVNKVSFAFGQQSNVVLAPSLGMADLLTASLVVIVVASIASLQPAWKASRMDPIAALRHT